MRPAYLVTFVLAVAVGVAWLVTSARAQGDDVVTFQMSLGTPIPNSDAGVLGSGNGEFVFPFGVAIDKTGRFIVTDTYEWEVDYDGDGTLEVSNRLQIFRPDGTLEQVVRPVLPPDPSDPTNPTTLAYPTSVAVDNDDRIVVTDNDNNRIVVLSPVHTPDGALPAQPQVLQEFGTFGNFDPLSPADDPTYEYYPPGTAPMDRFSWPSGVSVKPGTRLLDPTDGVGRVAVVDNGNHRVVVLNSMLVPVFQFGGHTSEDNPPGTFEYPWGVTIDAQGRFFVSDTNNHRVQVFDQNGVFQWMFGADSTGGAPAPGDLSSPSGLTIDSSGRLLVADTDRSRVLRIDIVNEITGSTLPPCSDVLESQAQQQCQVTTEQEKHYAALVLGGADSGPGNFRYAQGVATDAQDRVAVVDTDRQLVRVFQPARLEIVSATVTAGPDGAVVGKDLQLTVTVANRGGAALQVTVGATASLPGTLTEDLPKTIQPGQQEQFTLTFRPDQGGALTFSVAAEGLHTSSGGRVHADALTTTAIDIAPATVHLFATVDVDRTFVAVDHTITVTVTLHNTGNTTFSTVSTDVPTPSIVELLSAPDSPCALPKLESCDLTFSYKANAEGTVSFSAKVTASYSDSNGSHEYPEFTATSETVRISTDVTPPATTAKVPPSDGNQGWYRTAFSLPLTATDSGSGVKSISYRVVGGGTYSGTTPGSSVMVPVNLDGTWTVSFSALDNAGNQEPWHTLAFRLDSAPPTLGQITVSPGANADGWHHTDVVVQAFAGDATSGVVAVPPIIVTTEGVGQHIPITVYDVAGNTARGEVVLSIDKTPPVLACTGALLWPPTHKMVPWVTSVTATDAMSGIAGGFELVAATSNEPDNGRGDGNTTDDIQGFLVGTPDTAGFVRAERSGRGSGRVYSLTYQAQDVAGNIGSCVVTAQAPHDQGDGDKTAPGKDKPKKNKSITVGSAVP